MIDVIIPAYNAYDTIERTLKSIEKQTIKSLLKVYIVDDCSSRDYNYLKDLFDLDNYDEAEKELQSLIFRKDEFHPAIYEIIRKSISPRYKSFIYHLKDKRIEKQVTKLKMHFKKQCQNQENEHSRPNEAF